MSTKQTFRQAKTYVASRTFMQTDPMLVKADDDGLAARFLTVFLSPVPLLRPTEALDEEFTITTCRIKQITRPLLSEMFFKLNRNPCGQEPRGKHLPLLKANRKAYRCVFDAPF